MAELVQSIRIEFDDAISAGIKRATAQTKTFNSNLNRASKSLKNMGKASVDLGKKLGIGLTAPIAAAGAVMVKTAIDAEETANKFNVVFKDVAKQSKEVANALAKDYGMSSEESQKLLSNTGDLLTGFGMSGKAALSMSEDVQKLAADLGSFNNISAERASQALTSGLLGEREAMKSLGIVINEEMVKNMVEAMTVAGKFTEETEQQRKAIATLKLATMQSGNAIGDFARSQGSLANQIKILKAQASDLSAEFGAIMIPIVLDLINAIKPLISRFKNMSPEMKKTVVIISALVAGIAPLLIAFGSISMAIGTLLPIITGLGTAFTVVAGVISGPMMLAVAAIAGGAFLIIDNWTALKEFFTNIFDNIDLTRELEEFKRISEKIAIGFKKSWQSVLNWFKNAFPNAFEFATNAIDKIVSGIEKVKSFLSSDSPLPQERNANRGRSISTDIQEIGTFEQKRAGRLVANRANAIASESNINNNNNVIVNLAVDKNGNPILESASSDNGLNNVDVNMGLITP